MVAFKDERLARLWDILVESCPELGRCNLPHMFDSEMKALGEARVASNADMKCIRVFCGLAVMSRMFFLINEDQQNQLIKRLREHCRRYSNVDAHLDQLMATIFEMQVATRFAYSGMSPTFIQPSNRSKRPDILIEDRGILIECKNLAPKDFETSHVDGMCATMRKQSRKAVGQFQSYDPENQFEHLVLFHLPPAPRGFFTGHDMGERVNLSLAASGSEDTGFSGRPGPLMALLVETSFTPMYGRPGAARESMDYWHIPSPDSGKHMRVSRLFWDLFMAMHVCPFEGFQYPIRVSQAYLQGRSMSERKEMRFKRAMKYWQDWNVRTGSRFGAHEVPPCLAIPSQAQLDEMQRVGQRD